MPKDKYNYNINSYLIILETDPLNNNAVGGLGTVVIITCGIIVFTSVFCIKNSFDISIAEKTKQYGMLKSVGATKKQIRKNVFFNFPTAYSCVVFFAFSVLSGNVLCNDVIAESLFYNLIVLKFGNGLVE